MKGPDDKEKARARKERIRILIADDHTVVPTSGDTNGKTIRRVVIFDNHPDSLPLVRQATVDVTTDDAASRREMRRTVIVGLSCIAMFVAAGLWSLWP
jgi:hypothetical protein